MIRAGRPHDLSRSGALAILDIGFARRDPTCGLLLPDQEAGCFQYGEARSLLERLVTESRQSITLVIEAPLSVAFSSDGNPTGRSIEHRSGQVPRYWYQGLGCGVMVAALYLIKGLAAASPRVPVRLFEGFVSFKPRSKKPTHLEDVALLHQIVRNSTRHALSIVASDKLKAEPTDSLRSAGDLCGFGFGIPAVLIPLPG